MTSKCGWIAFFGCLVLVIASLEKGFADSAEVLPKGVSRLSVDYNYYQSVTDRFGPNGKTESVATDFNAVLDATVLPGLIPTIVPGLYIGESVVDFEYEFRDLILNYQYGLSDKVTIGIRIPYYWNKTDLKEARVEINDPLDPFLIPLDPPCGLDPTAPGYEVCVTQAVLATLEGPPFSFDPFESWKDSGLSDIEVGLRYQYYRDEKWRLAFTGGVRLPTGETDDPDNLLDTEFGTGAMALLMRFHQDFIGTENLLLDLTVKYDLVLPDKETVRVPNDVNLPLAPEANREKVDRDQGDILAFELYGDWGLSDSWSINALYVMASRQKDKVDGDLGLAYESLEDETDWEYQSFTAGVTYSTVSRYMDEEASIPLEIGLSYETIFDGSNNYLEQDLYTLGMTLYF
jgi:hypothetical protein